MMTLLSRLGLAIGACSKYRGKTLTVAIALMLAAANAAGAADDQADPFATQLGKLINDYRAQRDVPPLTMDAPLADLAHEHAVRMARDKRLSHDGFQERFAKAGSPRCVENVGWNQRTPEAEFAGWRDSPTHARNLLDPGITRMGIGIEDRYVTFFACR